MINYKPQAEVQYTKPAPSAVLSKLAALNHRPVDNEPRDRVTRSSGFSEPPSNGDRIHNRDEHLAIIEDLEPGPTEHTPPSDDPDFQLLEPNSGIRLRFAAAVCYRGFGLLMLLFRIAPDPSHTTTCKTIYVVATISLLHGYIHLFGYYPTNKDMMFLCQETG